MWLSFALFSALFLAVRRVYEKRLTTRFGNFSLSFVLLAFSAIPTLALFLFFPIPHNLADISWQFWWVVPIIWFVLYPLGNYFLYRSLREGELSEVTPVGTMLPVLNIASSFFILHELPSTVGVLGIVATVVATYLLLTDVGGFRAQKYNLAVLFMLGNAATSALGSTLDKVGIEASTPVFYSFANVCGASVVFLLLTFLYRQQQELKQVKEFFGTLCVLGVVMMLGFTAAMFAFSYGPTSYVLAVRSGGFLLAALWGIIFLHESLSKKKIVALVLFTLGTLALAIG